MLKSSSRRPLPIAVLWIVAAAASSQAGVIITLSESGGNVVANASGSLDLRGLRWVETAAYPLLIYPAVGVITLGSPWESVESYDGVTGWPANFGSGGNTPPDSSSGVFFAIGGNTFAIQPFYANFYPISSSASWQDTTLDQLGVTPGTYTWSWSTDSITLNAVPEPATVAMALAGLACGVVSMWRRRKRYRLPGVVPARW